MGVKKGFTFIEMVVVIGVIALILPAIFAIIFVILQQQTKIIRLSEVKRQGDYVLNVMENTVRNYAVSNHSGWPVTDANIVCATTIAVPQSSSYFKDKSNNSFGYELDTGQIVSKSSLIADTFLTTTKVVVSGLSLVCTRSQTYSPPVVSLNFDICYNVGSGNCISTRPEETATLHYQTSIKLRNY